MTGITTHILDTSRGRPAADVEAVLERAAPHSEWQRLSSAKTDAQGRITDFPGAGPLVAGAHRLRFNTAAYFAAHNTAAFFPVVEITFHVSTPTEHYHVPLLLSPWGYSTYRGS